MKKIVLCCFLAFVMVLGIIGSFSPSATANAQDDKKNYNGLKIGYIPVDDRPVNYERAMWLAKSVGIELVMPERDLFRTALDNMKPNSNGTTYGDREALVEWLKEADKQCDYFVISLDQMISGGLVASRWMSNTDLSLEYEIADYIISLAENNTVVLFDTVMRLASTVNYQGYKIDEYNELRKYGATARKQLEGDELTVDNIIAGYKYGKNGKVISSSLSDEKIDRYLASRARKLKLNDYILSHVSDTLDFCYIGVDDSMPQTTVQSNEIRYIQNKIGDNGVIYAAIDELGLMGITRIITKLYGSAEVGVTYYGKDGEKLMADSFDYMPLEDVVNLHIKSLNCTTVKGGEGDIQLLVLTQSATNNDIKNMVVRAKRYINDNVPVIVLDPNSGNGSKLQKEMISYNVPLTMLLGYSNWNTAANATGIALSNGLARYTYLKNAKYITAESHMGFLQAGVFGYLKDMVYKYGATSYETVLKIANGAQMITSLQPYTVSDHGTVSMSNLHKPWNRDFEVVFDINISPELYNTGDIDGNGEIKVKDYLLTKRIVSGTLSPTDVQLKRADADGNGKVDTEDCAAIRKEIK